MNDSFIFKRSYKQRRSISAFFQLTSNPFFIMKYLHSSRLFFILLLIGLAGQVSAANDSLSTLVRHLRAMPQVYDITPMETKEFNEKYQFFVTQPLDHSRPETGQFRQRVILSHLGFDRPTLLVTEGYGARHAMNASYREELSKLFDMNILFVEHRYFLESTPDPLNWDFLTVENSAWDLHTINALFRTLYSGKWASTGVSKGGQTTLFYRAYFPDDVDFSVAYVAPLNRAVEDGRHEPFLRKVGTSKARKKIQDYQLRMFRRKETMMPLFANYCREKQILFHRPIEEIYDFCLLEYPFAFWQWGTPLDHIPGKQSDEATLLQHLLDLCEPSYFSYESQYLSFFVQAARELGYYGYDTKPFKKYLSIRTSEDYLRQLMLPGGLENMPFQPALYQKTHQFLLNNDPKLICIYGEVDPWTASGVTEPTYFKGKKNLQLFIQPSGSHRTRIHTLPETMQTRLIGQIRDWLTE